MLLQMGFSHSAWALMGSPAVLQPGQQPALRRRLPPGFGGRWVSRGTAQRRHNCLSAQRTAPRSTPTLTPAVRPNAPSNASLTPGFRCARSLPVHSGGTDTRTPLVRRATTHARTSDLNLGKGTGCRFSMGGFFRLLRCPAGLRNVKRTQVAERHGRSPVASPDRGHGARGGR